VQTVHSGPELLRLAVSCGKSFSHRSQNHTRTHLLTGVPDMRGIPPPRGARQSGSERASNYRKPDWHPAN
jgi:hypothetical protein